MKKLKSCEKYHKVIIKLPIKREGMREREREREREKEKEKEKKRKRERKRKRETEKERERKRETERKKNRETQSQCLVFDERTSACLGTALKIVINVLFFLNFESFIQRDHLITNEDRIISFRTWCWSLVTL
jgi:uncharacterized membrane protein YdbT with pleckstrin-like domain